MTEEEIFHAALARSGPVERAAYLEQACAGDPALRASVEALLRANVGATGFLDRAPAAPTAELDQGDVVGDVAAEEDLGFLTPCDKPEVLGCLGHYEILEVLGRGGMGVVLRAFDAKLHRVVAIKVMAAHLATNGSARKRFMREAQAQAAVSHDHVVTIHAVEEASRLPYLAMQYVAGGRLGVQLYRHRHAACRTSPCNT